MTYYLSLGSNLGAREQTIHEALKRIGQQVGTVLRCSSFFYSEPWGFSSENAFVNAVVCIHTTLTPHRLLRATQRIERQMGKTRRHATQRADGQPDVYHDRPIDIDILLYDDLTLHTPTLTIPHPHMHERPFVTIPLQEIKQAPPLTPPL